MQAEVASCLICEHRITGLGYEYLSDTTDIEPHRSAGTSSNCVGPRLLTPHASLVGPEPSAKTTPTGHTGRASLEPLVELGTPLWAISTHRSEWASLEFQVGQPSQEFLVGPETPVGITPTRRSEQAFLEFQVGRPIQEFLVGLGEWPPLLAEASRPSWNSRLVNLSRSSWLGWERRW
jgi:hypothetical protein